MLRLKKSGFFGDLCKSGALAGGSKLQAIAADVGFSETAFATREGNAWRVRYFSPRCEVPFCGHATIALGAALAVVECLRFSFLQAHTQRQHLVICRLIRLLTLRAYGSDQALCQYANNRGGD